MHYSDFYISKSDLVDKQWYEGRCRNSSQAQWNAEKQRFEYIRTKFTMKFREEICAPEDEKHYDVFYAKKAIPLNEVKEPISEKDTAVSGPPKTEAVEGTSLRPDIFQEARE